jgi:hypothetical protein
MVAYDFVMLPRAPPGVTPATLHCAIKSQQPGKADKPEIPSALLGVVNSLCYCFVRIAEQRILRSQRGGKVFKAGTMLMIHSEIGLVLNQ